MVPVGLLPRSSPAASLATLAEAMPSSEQRLILLRLAQGVRMHWGRGCLAKADRSLVPVKQDGPTGWGRALAARRCLRPAGTWSCEDGASAGGLW